MKRRSLIVAALTFTLAVGLTACGDEKKDDATQVTQQTGDDAGNTADSGTGDAGSASDSVDMAAAAEQKWGDFTIKVPSNWKLEGGDFSDKEDKRIFKVKKSDLVYFEIKDEESEDKMKMKYDSVKTTYTNEQTEVSGKIGDIDWTGFQYSDGMGGYGFELYGKAGSKFLRISACGYKFDDPTTTAVLETLKVG